MSDFEERWGFAPDSDYETLRVWQDGYTISLCEGCWCMTKTIKGHCGKCGAKKEEKWDTHTTKDI